MFDGDILQMLGEVFGDKSSMAFVVFCFGAEEASHVQVLCVYMFFNLTLSDHLIELCFVLCPAYRAVFIAGQQFFSGRH